MGEEPGKSSDGECAKSLGITSPPVRSAIWCKVALSGHCKPRSIREMDGCEMPRISAALAIVRWFFLRQSSSFMWAPYT